MTLEYSAQFFSSSEMEDLFRRVFRPKLAELGFEPIGKNRWVRDSHLGFKHVFFLYPLRPCADYRPLGALSFDFVPRIEAGRVRLRSEPRFVRVHLSSDENPRLNKLALDSRVGRQRNVAEERCRSVAPKAVALINQWLLSFKSLADISSVLESLKSSQFYCFPEMALAHAFTLAKIGRRAEASAEIKRTLRSSYFDPDTHEPIRQLLGRIDEL